MHVTLLTSGKLSKTRSADGTDLLKVDVAEAEGSLKKFFVSGSYSLETKGAILEFYGPRGVVIEVLGVSEFGNRFPDLLRTNKRLVDAGGFCSLRSNGPGNYYCDQGSCTGHCTLHNIPVYCSCD